MLSKKRFISGITPSEVITLLGTQGSPQQRVFIGFDDTPPIAASNRIMTLCVNTAGDNGSNPGWIMTDGYLEGVLINLTNWHQWADPEDYTRDYWARWEDTLDDDPSPGTFSWNKVAGSWHRLRRNVDTNMWWNINHNGITTVYTKIKLEIATDAAGTNIIQTGYYRIGAATSP